MKKIIFFSLAIFFYFISGVNSGENYNPHIITVVGDKCYPPFEFLDSNGKPKGIFVDIWKLWEKKTNIKVEYKLVEWNQALEMVKNGKADVVGGLFYSKDRDKVFDFSIPFLELDTRIFFHKKIFAMEDLGDAIGFEVGVVKGDYAENYIKKNFPQIILKSYPTNEDMVKAAVSDKIKVFVSDTPVGLFILSKYKEGDNFKYSTKPIYTSKVYAGVKEGNKKLLKVIDSGFSKISKKEINNILKKWSGLSIHLVWIKQFLIILGALTAIVLFIFIWAIILKISVKNKTLELQQKNKELKKIYNKLKTLIETNGWGYVERDHNGTVIDVNEQYLKIIGRKREEVIGKNLEEWTHPEDRHLQKKARYITKEKGWLKGLELRYVRPDNSIVYIMAYSARLEEEPDRVVFLCQDITDKKIQEKEIYNLAKELEVTLSSIGDGVISTDKLGKIRFFNSVAENITGWKKEEAIGRDLSEVFNILSEETKEKVENPYQKIMRTKRIVGLGNHTLLVKKNGEKIPILDSGAPIVGKDGEILGVVIVFRDGTEQRRREQELIRLERLNSLSMISAGVAHDFNNLLATIVTNLSFLKEKKLIPEKQLALLEKIEKAALEARNLTKQLTLIAGNFSPEKRPIDYRKKLKDLTRLVLAGSSILAEFKINKELFYINGDETQIDQVIQNLLINAKEAMPEGGKITISAENIVVLKDFHAKLAPGTYVKISIKDQGIGIDEKHLSHIFDPYYSTKKGGTGLGLFVVQSVIKNHGGHIEVKSKVGEGTEFIIYLPATEKKQIKDVQEEKIGNLNNIKILFMDDEEMFRHIMEEILPQIGAKVTTVKNGEEAISAYQQATEKGNNFDVVILDMTIVGGKDGVTIGKEILEIDKNANIIISSGHTAHPIFKEYKKYGFKGAIKKPYTISELTNVINKTLNSH